VLRRLARWSWLYRAETERAFAQAKALGWVHGDESTWRQLKRLTSLVDHADHYLTRTRSDTWMQKHLTVSGEWPAPDAPGLLLTFHWGAGMWAQRHAGTAGVKASMMVDAPSPAHFQGHKVLFRYIQARIRSIELALHTPTWMPARTCVPCCPLCAAKKHHGGDRCASRPGRCHGQW
jgi:hypothetical protein